MYKRMMLIVLLVFLQMGTAYAHDESMRADAEQLREVSRGEFSNMVSYSLNLMDINETAYMDTRDHWARPYIGAVCAAELMSADKGGRFYPDRIMTLEEAATVLVRVLQVKPDQKASLMNRQVSEWAKPYVSAALKLGLIPDTNDYKKKLIYFDAISVIEKIDQAQVEKVARQHLQSLD